MQSFAEQTLDRTRRVSDMTVRSRTAASSAGGSSSPGLPCRWFLRCWSAGTGLQSRCRLLRKSTEDRHLWNKLMIQNWRNSRTCHSRFDHKTPANQRLSKPAHSAFKCAIWSIFSHGKSSFIASAATDVILKVRHSQLSQLLDWFIC